MKAVYAGSFDPYTNGHKSILKDAADIFEEVHVIIGVNSAKKRSFDAEKMKAAIEEDLKKEGINNCKVVIFTGLIALYCKDNGIRCLVRGLRNDMDYNYEENIAEVNARINPNIKSIYLRAEDRAISSSMVRELLMYDQDVSAYVPDSVLNLIKNR